MKNSRQTLSWRALIVIYIFLGIVALVCFIPILHIVAVSLSDKMSVSSGDVSVIPLGFTLNAYKLLMNNKQFLTSLGISFYRIVLGVPINMILCVLVAYPLSIDTRRFRARTKYVWFFALTMFFSGGIIPSYLLIRQLNMLNSIWALVLPNAVQIFYAILLLNFFRNIPKEISESAFVDGANHFRVLLNIYIPISKPALSTVLLFVVVGHWNSWFDGIIYMNDTARYPLQSFMQVMLSGISYLQQMKNQTITDSQIISNLSDRIVSCAEIVVGMLPIVIIYPLLQKYLIKGMVVGSVKG